MSVENAFSSYLTMSVNVVMINSQDLGQNYPYHLFRNLDIFMISMNKTLVRIIVIFEIHQGIYVFICFLSLAIAIPKTFVRIMGTARNIDRTHTTTTTSLWMRGI